MKRHLPALLLVAAAVGAGTLGVLCGRVTAPEPAATPPTVRVDTLWLERQRPNLERPSLGQKIATKAIKPERVLVADAPSSAGVEAVRRYCDSAPPAPTTTVEQTDTGLVVAAADIQKPSAAVLPDFGGRRDGPRLTLFSTLSDGRRWEWIGTARGRVTWQSCGDTACVRGDRWFTRVAREAPKCGAVGGAGGVLGAIGGQNLRESVFTGLLTALGCAF